MFKIICCILCFSFIGLAEAQNIDSLITLQKKIDPQEKTYVQFDKEYYNPGETIWFKAYLFTGIDPSIVSTNFFAELIDEKGTVISQKTAPIIRSGANSSFDLPENISNRILYFRAYTTSQLNGDTSFLFTKPIQIITSAISTKVVAPQNNSPVIQFLPEGGDWVAGLPCNMAFIATDANNLPIKANGYIKDDQGNKILEFSYLHDGMGNFSITPENGKKYTAVWGDGNQTHTTPLPSFKSRGIVLRILNLPTGIKFQLQRSDNSNDNLQNVKIVGYMNQQVAYTVNADLSGRRRTLSCVYPLLMFKSFSNML